MSYLAEVNPGASFFAKFCTRHCLHHTKQRIHILDKTTPATVCRVQGYLC